MPAVVSGSSGWPGTSDGPDHPVNENVEWVHRVEGSLVYRVSSQIRTNHSASSTPRMAFLCSRVISVLP